MKAVTNSEVQWDNFDIPDYYTQYDELIWDDVGLGTFAINALSLYEKPRAQFKVGVDICNGGVMLGPMYQAPYIDQDGIIFWTDIGVPQLQEADEAIAKGIVGELGRWQQHQDHLGAQRAEWADCGVRACKLGQSVIQSVFELGEEQDAADIMTCLFGPESATEDADEWRQGALGAFRTVRPGGLALMMFTEKSKNYRAGTIFPSYSVTADTVAKVARTELTGIQIYSVLPSEGARAAGDTHPFKCFSALVGQRKPSATTVLA